MSFICLFIKIILYWKVSSMKFFFIWCSEWGAWLSPTERDWGPKLFPFFRVGAHGQKLLPLLESKNKSLSLENFRLMNFRHVVLGSEINLRFSILCETLITSYVMTHNYYEISVQRTDSAKGHQTDLLHK